MQEKLRLPFSLLSDPEGDLAKRCELWNAEEGVARSALAVIDGSGGIRYLYSGGDFADRPGDGEVFSALDEVDRSRSGASGGPEVRRSAGDAEESTVRPERPAMTVEQLIPYYQGAHFTSVSLKERFADLGAAGEAPAAMVERYQEMVDEYGAALRETRKLARS